MATEGKNDELLFELRINKGTSEADVNAYTKSIEILAAETRDLLTVNESLKKSGDVLGSTYSENAKQIEANKQKISEEQTARKALVTVMRSEEDSIKALVAQNKLLIQERNSLSTKTEEGRARIDAINKAINANNAAIKENVSGLEKQKIGIGNYTGALDKLVPGLGSTIDGMKGMTAQALAFIATPIGIVIGALGLALGALIQYFKGSEEGQDRFNKVMQVGGVILEKITDLIEFVGKKIFETLGPAFEFVGNLISGVASAIGVDTKAVSDFFDEVDARAEQFASNERARNLALRELTVLRAQTEKQVSELIIKAQEAEGQAKLDFVNKAIGLRKTLLDKEKEYLKLQLDAANLAAEDDPTIENLQKQAEAKAALIQSEASYNESIKKLNAQRVATQKEVDDQIASDEAIAQANRHLVTDDLDQKAFMRKTDIKQREVQLATLTGDRILAVERGMDEQRRKLEQQHQQLIAQGQEAQIAGIGNVLGRAKFLFKQGSDAYKLSASGEAVINTRAAAIAAYKSLVGIPVIGPILAPIAAGVAIAFGVEQVAAINNVKFARGGQARGFTIGGRSHASGGTKFWGEDGTRFEAEADEGLFILKKDAHKDWISRLSKQNETFGGVSWAAASTRYAALGGSINLGPTTSSATDVVDVVEATMRNLPPIQVSVEDINRMQAQKASNQQFAQVL